MFQRRFRENFKIVNQENLWCGIRSITDSYADVLKFQDFRRNLDGVGYIEVLDEINFIEIEFFLKRFWKYYV